jgi:tRNA (cmo5U34)-methyltransferase
MKDNLYAKSQTVVASFEFDDEVARVFTDMITRSVPGYTMMLDILGVLSETKVQNNSHCYDIGCSLGASTLAIRQNITVNNCKIIGIDNSKAMIERCQQVIDNDTSASEVELICQDVLDIDFKPLSLCSMNLTLQFIKPEKRLELLSKIAQNTLDGGVLFLSEKIQFENTGEQQELTDLHHQFKKHQGYSDLEIAQKRNAIENVLIAETLETHQQRLLQAGFSKVYKVLQCFNFVSLIAIK